MIGLDTTAIIDYFKGDPSIKKLVDTVKEPIVTTQINYLEIFFGIDMENSKHRSEVDFYEEFFDQVSPLPLDRNASRLSSEIYWKLKKAGRNVGKFDCIIAGVFLSHGVTKIISRNVKHFENIPAVVVLSY